MIQADLRWMLAVTKDSALFSFSRSSKSTRLVGERFASRAVRLSLPMPIVFLPRLGWLQAAVLPLPIEIPIPLRCDPALPRLTSLPGAL